MGFLDTLLDIATLGLWDNVLDWLMPDVESENKGIDIERQGADQPIPVVYGTRKVGAIKVHKFTTEGGSDAKNDHLHLICVFSEGECESIDELFFNEVSENDQKFKRDFSRPIIDASVSKWFDYKVYLGAEGQPASAAAVSGIPNWTINHRLDGLCYVYAVLEIPKPEAQLQVWRGEPQIQAIIKGKKILDTRTGTVGFSSNPAMCLRDYLTNDIYGKSLDDLFIDVDSFNWVADACDEGTTNTITTTTYVPDDDPTAPPLPVVTTETVTLPRFACNLLLDTSRDYMENISEILSSFRGIVQDMTGSAKITYETTIDEQYGTTTGDTAFTFTADDIIGEVDHDGGSIDDRYNLVEVRFPSAAKEYETDSVFYPEESDPLRAQWLAEDGGKRQEQSIEVDSITTKAEALQMAEIVAKRSRFNRASSLTGMPWTIQIEVGDIVGLDSLMNGWTDKPFRVMEKKLNDDDTVDFQLREHEDAVYPWSGRTFDEIVGGTWLGDPDNLAAPTGLSLTADPTLSRTGTLRWTSSANAFVRRYEVRIVASDGSVVFDVDVIGNSYDVPLLDAGDYTALVFAVSQTGYRSPSSALAFTLAQPVAPTSLSVTTRDWELEVAPQLAGIGLGTVFEFDVVAGDGTGYTPSSKGRASTFTFTGLLPDTLYTVYARSVNAYGVSAWTSASATTTNTGAQVDPYLDTIRDELDSLETEFEGFDPSSSWFGGVDALLEGVSQNIAETFQRKQDVNTEQEKRIQQFDEISVTIDDVATSTNLRIDEVQADAAGNATAISGLQLGVNNLETGLSSTITDLNQVEITASGNATAVSTLQGQVNDPVNNTSALYLTAQEAQTTADGNASSITTILNGVTGEAGTADALLKLQAYYTDGGLGARAFLGTDVNDRVTGIIVNDSGTSQTIEFQSDSVTFLNAASQPVIYFDNVEGRYVFDGEIIAQAGTFTGTVNSATINGSTINGGSLNIGGPSNSNFVVDSDGNLTLGDAYIRTDTSASGNTRTILNSNTYGIWIGEGAATDTNAVFYVKKSGAYYIDKNKFDIGAGGVITEFNEATSTSPSASVSITHDRQGGSVDLTGYVNYTVVYDGDLSSMTVTPTLDVDIKRGTTTIASDSAIMSMNVIEVDNNVFETWFSARLSVETRDTSTVSGLTSYSCDFSRNAFGGTAKFSNSRLTIKSLENI